MINIRIYGTFTTGKNTPEEAALYMANAINEAMKPFRYGDTEVMTVVEITPKVRRKRKVKVMIES